MSFNGDLLLSSTFARGDVLVANAMNAHVTAWTEKFPIDPVWEHYEFLHGTTIMDIGDCLYRYLHPEGFNTITVVKHRTAHRWKRRKGAAGRTVD